MSFRLLLVLLCAGSLVSCYAAPRIDDDKTEISRAQNVFAHDLSVSGFVARFDHMARVLSGAGKELDRTRYLETGLGNWVVGHQGDVAALPTQAKHLIETELGRWQKATIPAPLRPDLDRWTRTLAGGLAEVPSILHLDHRPLDEPSDQEHRTDPHDERPEVSFWERIRRRLQL